MQLMSAEGEALHFRRMLDDGGIDTGVLRRLSTHLFAAKAVRLALDGEPMKARSVMDAELARSHDLAAQPREAFIRSLQAEFGMDACIRQLNYMGYRLAGVDRPEKVEVLGDRPCIRLDDRVIFRDRPQLVRDVFAVLTGATQTSEATLRQVSQWVGIDHEPGVLTLHREDGRMVESGNYPGYAIDHHTLPAP